MVGNYGTERTAGSKGSVDNGGDAGNRALSLALLSTILAATAKPEASDAQATSLEVHT